MDRRWTFRIEHRQTVSVDRLVALRVVLRTTRRERVNLPLMRLLDEQYTRTPSFGVLKMTDVLIMQGTPSI